MATTLMSMTGYGEASARDAGATVRVRCRSVNHKGLKVRLSLPQGAESWEAKFRGEIQSKVSRGRVEVRLEVEYQSGDASTSLAIDDEQFGEVANRLKQLCEEHRIAAPTLQAILEYRETIAVDPASLLDSIDEKELLDVLRRALTSMVANRQKEGDSIASDLRGYLDDLDAHLSAIRSGWPPEQQRRISRARKRLDETLEKMKVDGVDKDRVAQELAHFVDRGDIAEELQRADAHIKQLKRLVEESEGARGKKIDFYLQEMIRETNTMGSKCQSARLTDRVIEMKSLVEKMREQAANVE